MQGILIVLIIVIGILSLFKKMIVGLWNVLFKPITDWGQDALERHLMTKGHMTRKAARAVLSVAFILIIFIILVLLAILF